LKYRDLGNGISCIDADYGAPGMACFYLLEHKGCCVVIETGTSHSVANLKQCMADKGLRPEQVRYVVPTHVHLDHAGGAGAMMAIFPEAQLVVHPKGARHLIAPEKLIASSIAVYGEDVFRKLYGDVLSVPASRVIEAPDGMLLDVEGRELVLRHTPGHADHHFCVWDQLSQGWFSGDMFGVCYQSLRFASGDFVLASTTPTQFSPDQYLQSLALLRSYAPRSMYLTHYGELSYSDELCQNLGEQVRGYAALATELSAQPEQLEPRLLEYCAGLMQRMGAALNAQQVSEIIGFDTRLNAQGLHVWLARQQNVRPDA
jgi:glyoxylase-like metal-dependent hydrolase (beta-lactamase superfamily II)